MKLEIWYKTNPPHLVAVGQGAEAYIQAERTRLDEAGQPTLDLTPESVGSLSSQASDLWPEPLFVVAGGAITKMVSELCELIAKQGRALNIHLLAAYPDMENVSSTLQENAQILEVYHDLVLGKTGGAHVAAINRMLHQEALMGKQVQVVLMEPDENLKRQVKEQ